jgi:peptidoglycan/LPS O-acetylase OafA/YrhL
MWILGGQRTMVRTTVTKAGRDLELLDLIRGVGFFMVVLTHCLEFNDLRAQVLPQIPPVVDLFFLISGFVAGYGNDVRLRDGSRRVGEIIVRRIVRLFPLVVLGTLLGAMPLFLRLVYWGDTQHLVPALIVFVRGCLLIPTPRSMLAFGGIPDAFPFDVPLWFLFFDLLGFLFYLFCLRFLSLRWLVVVATVSGFGLWKLALARNTLNPGAWYPDLLSVTPRALFDFTFGYILFRLYKPGHWKSGSWTAAWPLGLLLLALFAPLPQDSVYSGAFQAAIVCLVLPLVLIMSIHISIGPSLAAVARQTGRLALAVYALHFPIIDAIQDLAERLHVPGTAATGLALLEGLSCLVIAALATFYFDEPVRAYLMNRLKSRQVDRSKSSSLAV